VHLEGFLRNSTDSDSQSAKFRAHAEQTLKELQEMGGPAREPTSPETSPNDSDNGAEHLKRPEA
jgi:hypothetical protein